MASPESGGALCPLWTLLTTWARDFRLGADGTAPPAAMHQGRRSERKRQLTSAEWAWSEPAEALPIEISRRCSRIAGHGRTRSAAEADGAAAPSQAARQK